MTVTDWKIELGRLIRNESLPEGLRNVLRQVRYRYESEPDSAVFIGQLMRQARYAADLVASKADTSWLDEERFAMAYAEAAGFSAWRRDIRWRMHVLTRAARIAASRPGDFVECGVDRGGSAMCVIRTLDAEDFVDRQFWLFDTFEGHSEADLTENERARQALRAKSGRYVPVLDEVRDRFAPFPFVKVRPGRVPETLSDHDGSAIAFLHLDMNAAGPERAALEHFWPLLAPGAAVVLDDYAFPDHAPQRETLDAVVRDKGTAIISLPTGQGLIWR